MYDFCMRRLAIALALVLPSLMAKTIEKFAGLPTGLGGENDKPIWSYQLHEMIKGQLYKDGAPIYQDLEFVFDICHGGGFVDHFGTLGLDGNWSASASVPLGSVALDDLSTTTPNKGGAWKNPGLAIKVELSDGTVKTWYTNGYSSQYIKGIQDTPDKTVKDLHDQAVTKNSLNDNRVTEPGKFQSGGDGANFKITGNAETKSKHAIVYHGGAVRSRRQHNVEELVKALKGDRLKYDSVTTLFSKGPIAPAPGFDNSDWKHATKEELENALKKAREELLKNEGKEKLLFFVEGHGAATTEKRVFKTKDGDPPIPGEGFTFNAQNPSISIPFDAAEQRLLQEDVPDGSGGFLADSPDLERYTRPILNLTTYAESVTSPVGVYIGGIFAGDLMLNGTRGDYDLPLDYGLLAALPWNSGMLDLDITFQFASATDSFQISTSYDLQDSSFASQFAHYGLGVRDTLGQGRADVPEPATAVLLLAGFGILAAASGLTRRRREARVESNAGHVQQIPERSRKLCVS
jgi:hypothetical protein